ncbi:hypothetical protein [Mycobacterium scrofulaceum]|uniref:Uncharacterized protein n=1 Tax=Mycobacterium scrofulaceum TaxID=1783 RepID=A0A1A2VRP0_MYCSC|nr:hypothetical protein [Mycobacterium scrofulaceum]OBI03999.1 hypothetical protein A5679_15780 [Mycobacterium scrofulaceum]
MCVVSVSARRLRGCQHQADAAKGIIRFPELTAQKGRDGEVGIDEVTEYFLVGSFTSWLLALGGIGLVLATP